MKKNEEKSAMGEKKRGRGRGRPRKIVQMDGSDSSHERYIPPSASCKYIVGDPSRYPLRSKEVDNQGKEDTSPIQNQNVSANKPPKLNSKRKVLEFLHSQVFDENNLFSGRVDVEENITTKRAQKTSVANFKEMASTMNRGSSHDVTENVTTKHAEKTSVANFTEMASIMNPGSSRDVKNDDDDDDDEIEVGATVAENVTTEYAENTSIAHGLNVTGIVNRGLRDVKVDDDDDDDEIESSIHSVFGNVKGGGADDVVENVTPERTSIAHSFNVTEMASMMNRGPRDVDDEIESSRHPIPVNVKGYNVKPEVAPLFEKIIKKHGDIGKNCDIRCEYARGLFVDMMCSVYQKLEDTNLMDVTDVELEGLLVNVNVLQNQKFEVKWLSERVEDVLNTKNMIKEHRLMKEEEAKTAEAIKKKEKEIDGHKEKLFNAKAELVVLKAELEKVNRKSKNLKEKGNVYLNKSLVHGLV